MKTINGVYTSAHIFTTNNETTAIDNYAIHQLQSLCDNEVSKGCRIRVMPDVHPGIVGTIGLTMTIGDKLMPNLTGIDIGCGITLAQIKCKKIEYQKLDTVIRENIPFGGLEILCAELHQSRLAGVFAEEIFPDTGTPCNGGAVCKVKVVFVIHMYIVYVCGNIFNFILLHQVGKCTSCYSVQDACGTVQAQTCVAEVLGTLIAASVLAVILQEIIAACSGFLEYRPE